jgi:cytochrome c biogenesis protein CcdA
MTFGAATYGLGFLAGVLTILSPCVLPLLPILVASALSAHRLGPLALALGLGLAFAAAGIFLATLGSALGLDGSSVRQIAAGLMLLCGLSLLSGRLQAVFARAGAPLASTAQRWLGKVRSDTLLGQGAIGLLLGVVWSPCVGPTLGAATTLAAQGRDLAQIAALMAVFGLGAALPLAGLGTLAGNALRGSRRRLDAIGRVARPVAGIWFVLTGILVLSGLDRALETGLLALSPAWLTALTTSF